MKYSFYLLLPFFFMKEINAQKNKNYTVKMSWDTTMHILREGDIVKYSSTHKLAHYRKNKLIRQYTIVPRTIKLKRVAPCQRPPCPIMEYERTIYYVESWQRFILFDDLSDKTWLKITKEQYEINEDSLSTKNYNWEVLARLKKM